MRFHFAGMRRQQCTQSLDEGLLGILGVGIAARRDGGDVHLLEIGRLARNLAQLHGLLRGAMRAREVAGADVLPKNAPRVSIWNRGRQSPAATMAMPHCGMGAAGSSAAACRKLRSASRAQNECICARPWSKNCCASGLDGGDRQMHGAHAGQESWRAAWERASSAAARSCRRPSAVAPAAAKARVKKQRRISWMVLQLACDQMRELIGAVIGAFDLGGQASIAPDDRGSGIVADGAFLGPVDFAKGGGERATSPVRKRQPGPAAQRRAYSASTAGVSNSGPPSPRAARDCRRPDRETGAAGWRSWRKGADTRPAAGSACR